jgi:hypothetical protein
VPIAGLAHVATVSFLASRVSPAAQFWLALGGGLAVARASALHGLRSGIGASTAAIVQTVALIGPARINAPLTQALSAPVLGRLHVRGAGAGAQFAATLAIRLAHYVVLLALAIWVVLGGLDAFTGSYDALTGWIGFAPRGTAGAVAVVLAGQLIVGAFFSAVQVALYRRALCAWPERPAADPAGAQVAAGDPAAQDLAPPAAAGRPARFAPGPLALVATAATAALLAFPSWPVLISVAVGLAAAWPLARAESGPAKLGAALAALLAAGALAGALLAGLGVEEAARRALRAALLVGVATWLRAAARADGMRALCGSLLRAAGRLPGAREADAILERLDDGPALERAARSAPDHLRDVPLRPDALADALTRWVAGQAAAFPAR